MKPLLSVILNEAAGGVKDLGHDNVQEMCPPDSSLTLRMTERALRMTCKGCYAGATICADELP